MQNDEKFRDSDTNKPSPQPDTGPADDPVPFPQGGNLSRQEDQSPPRPGVALEVDKDFVEAQRQFELGRLKEHYQQSFGISLSDEHVEAVANFDDSSSDYQAFEFRTYIDREFEQFGYF